MSASRRPRVLFMCEAVTLAHATRLICLASSLDPARYEITIAVDRRFDRILFPEGREISRSPILELHSIPSELFLANLSKGRPLFDARVLETYVSEDLEIFRRTAPDVVVGDLRLSLAVSARLAGIRYVSVTNAHWSPHAERRTPVPDLPLTRALGITIGQALFSLTAPLGFALHARPLSQTLRRHGLHRSVRDLRDAYTDSDLTLYADIPELVPIRDLPGHHAYLGPVLWSPRAALPSWWESLPPGRPTLYWNLGTSGPGGSLVLAARALGDLPINVLFSTAGGALPDRVPRNFFIAPYLPGIAAAARSAAVVCNGGSATVYQALSQGVPVLGVASNMDQLLTMSYVEDAGAGIRVHTARAAASYVRTRVLGLLSDPSYPREASRLADHCARYRSDERFEAVLSELTGNDAETAAALPAH